MTSPFSVDCPICCSTNIFFLRKDIEDLEYFVSTNRKFEIWSCEDCNSHFLNPRPVESELPEFYPADYHAYHDDHGIIAKTLVSIRAYFRAKYYQKLIGNFEGSLFDVGTGDCRHFDALKRYCKLKFSGVEIKESMVTKAKAGGYDVSLGTLETMDISQHIEKHDIVSANHVLEHVIYPRLLVERSFQILKPGGYLIGQLPTNSCLELKIFGRFWGGYHFPRHLQALSRQSLHRMLKEFGFIDVKIKSTPHLQAALSLQNFIVGHFIKNPHLKFGKLRFYSFLLVIVAPFEILFFLLGKSGIVDIEAKKPVD